MDKESLEKKAQYHPSDNSLEIARSQLRTNPLCPYYPKESPPISVSEPKLRSSLFSKHIQYLIAGCDSQGRFETNRRYKEFYSLRKSLFSQWPGCSVPQLPPKQKLGNLESTFIESRRFQLENFLQKLSQSEHLYASEELQHFLRGPKDFHKSEVSQKPVNYKLISEKYIIVFKDYLNCQRDSQVEKEIGTILGHLNNGISNFESLARLCSEQYVLMRQNMTGVARMVKGIIDTRVYLEDKAGDIDLKNFEDPFLEMVQWCKNSNLAVAGIIECIFTQYELQRLKTQVINKIEGEKEKIQTHKEKKSKFWGFLRKKPAEFYIGKAEAEIESLSGTAEGLQIILDITSALIVSREYPKFKDETKNEFLVILKKISVLYEESCGVFVGNFMVALN